MRIQKYISLVLRIIVAGILIQTLRFKFTAHPISVYIFTEVGMEPAGRIFIGIFELIAAILILIPRASWLGALLSVGVLSGAIFMHLTILGIDVQGDGGELFWMALITWVLSVIVFWIHRDKVKKILKIG